MGVTMAVMRTDLIASAFALALLACSSGESAPPMGTGGVGDGSGGARPVTGDASDGSGGAGRAGGGATGSGGMAPDATAGSTGGTESGTDGAAAGPSGPTVGELMGLNGFIDDDKAKLAAVGNVREYHSWTWNDGNGDKTRPAYPNNQLEFSLWSGFWDFDDYYAKLRASGVLVLPCIQGSVAYLGDAMPPVPSGADETAPASYAAHASFMFQYAARYGNVKVPASSLKLLPGQAVLSGLGTLEYFENGNEPDANWVKSDGSFLFSPEATAAMSSADYDGHKGAMGAGFGVKTADPSAKMVLAGLAGAGKGDWALNVTSYLDGIRSWATAHRGGSFPADVINVHDYCFGPDPFGTANPRPALSPEACKLGELLSRIAAYRDGHLPGKEVWLTEFGYDTHPRSRLRAPQVGSSSAEVVQGQWLVRSFLALMGTGIERAFLFVSRDSCTGTDTACPNNAVQFSTSGVLTEQKTETAKTAWYYLATFRSRLSSMRYQGTSPSGNPNVSIARLYDAANRKGAYVVWAPTSDGTVVPGYSLAVASGMTSASIVTLKDGSTTGDETQASVTGGNLALAVSETPTLVLVGGEP
jgi:hypothetical protein